MTYKKTMPTEDRFWSKVKKTDGCWMWLAGKNGTGYGIFRSTPTHGSAHRYSYELHHGPIPPGMLVDHTCHQRDCVNPDHLRLATQKQNLENREGAMSNSKSGIRGVSPTPSGKWMATVVHRRVQHYCGTFADINEAEAAVKAKRLELFTHNIKDRQ